MNNSNNLYQKRNLLIFQKLMKGINVDSGKILQEITFPRASQALEAIERLSNKSTPLGLAINKIKRILDLTSTGNVQQKLQDAIEQIVQEIKKEKTFFRGKSVYGKSTAVQFLEDPNIPLDAKAKYIQYIENNDFEQADRLKRSTSPITPDATPHFGRHNYADLNLLGGGGGPVKTFFNVTKAYDNYIQNISQPTVPKEYQLIRNIIEFEGGALDVETANKLILRKMLGDNEYNAIVEQYTNPVRQQGRVTSQAISESQVTSEMILKKINPDEIAEIRYKFKRLQNSLHDYFNEMGIKIGENISWFQRASENYQLAMATATTAEAKKIIISAHMRFLHQMAGFIINWAAPYKPTSWGIIPKTIGFIKTQGTFGEKLFNNYKISVKSNWTINLILGGTALYAWNLYMEKLKNIAIGYNQEKDRIERDLAELEDEGKLKSAEIQELKKELTDIEAYGEFNKDLASWAAFFYFAPGVFPRAGGGVVTGLGEWIWEKLSGKEVKSKEVQAKEYQEQGKRLKRFKQLKTIIFGMKITSLFSGLDDSPQKKQIMDKIDALQQYIKDVSEQIEGVKVLGMPVYGEEQMSDEQYNQILKQYAAIMKEIKALRKVQDTKKSKEQGAEQKTEETPEAPTGPVGGL